MNVCPKIPKVRQKSFLEVNRAIPVLTQQVFHALSRLDDFSADRGAADAVQDVVSFTDDLMKKKTVSVKKYCFCSLKCAHFFELVKLCVTTTRMAFCHF